MVKTSLYQGQQLTDPEIQLAKFHQERAANRRRQQEEKLAEEKLLSQYSMPLSYYNIPEVKPQVIETKNGTDKDDSSDEMDVEEPMTATANTAKNTNNAVTISLTKKGKFEPIEDTENTNNSNKVANSKPVKKEAMAINNNNNASIDNFNKINNMDQSTMDAVTAAGTVGTNTVPVVPMDNSYKIKKKQRIDDTATAASSSTSAGKMMYGMLSHTDWNPKNGTLPREFLLNNFNMIDTNNNSNSNNNNNTLIITCTVPSTSQRWSFNISPVEHKDYHDITYHFNPRYGNKPKQRQLIVNDQQGTWGESVKYDVETSVYEKLTSTNRLELTLQIRPQGYFMFVNKQFLMVFPHRRKLDSLSALLLSFPADDGMRRHSEDVIIHTIWWGNSNSSSSGLQAVPASVLAYLESKTAAGHDDGHGVEEGEPYDEGVCRGVPDGNMIHRTVEIRGLPVTDDPVEVYEMEKACRVLLEDYSVEEVLVVGNKGYGYGRLLSAENVQSAIDDLDMAEMSLLNDASVNTIRLSHPGGSWLPSAI